MGRDEVHPFLQHRAHPFRHRLYFTQPIRAIIFKTGLTDCPNLLDHYTPAKFSKEVKLYRRRLFYVAHKKTGTRQMPDSGLTINNYLIMLIPFSKLSASYKA